LNAQGVWYMSKRIKLR